MGVEAGVSIPGQQDLKFKRHDAQGALTDYLFSADVDSATEAFESIYATAWVPDGVLKDFGLQLEASHWTTHAHANSYINRLTESPPTVLPPFPSVKEERLALLVSLLHKFNLPGSDRREGGAYGFGGLGAGRVYTTVTHGHNSWNIGGQALAGVSLPLGESTRLRLLGRYFLAHDQDCNDASTDWCVDTSGTATFSMWPHLASSPGWPHTDTRFFIFTVGFEFDF